MGRAISLLLSTVFVLVACTSAAPVLDRDDGGAGSGVAAEPTPDAAAARAERRPLLEDGRVYVARPRERFTHMWRRLGGGKDADFAFDTRNPFGRLAPLLIEHAKRREGKTWYEVLLPMRPNGATAWVRASDVRLRQREDRIEVDLSDRILRHFRGDELLTELSVGVGTDRYPTGVGRFYIWVKVHYPDPSNPYGAMALGLSGFSPVLSEWPGGGRMAVHGTPFASDRGREVSHGCVRVFNGDLASLTGLPLGTPVEIQA